MMLKDTYGQDIQVLLLRLQGQNNRMQTDGQNLLSEQDLPRTQLIRICNSAVSTGMLLQQG